MLMYSCLQTINITEISRVSFPEVKKTVSKAEKRSSFMTSQ